MTTVGVFAAIFDEAGRVLCVHRNYGRYDWTMPGGRLEPNESPVDGVLREVTEETGYLVEIERFVGTYSLPVNDDIVLFFQAAITGRAAWQPDGEISEIGFFSLDALPQPFSPRMAQRVQDARAGRTSLLHVFNEDDFQL